MPSYLNLGFNVAGLGFKVDRSGYLNNWFWVQGHAYMILASNITAGHFISTQ